MPKPSISTITRNRHGKTMQRVQIEIDPEDLALISDALYFAVSYQEDDFGSGWSRDEDGREARRQWRRTKAISDALISITEQ